MERGFALASAGWVVFMASLAIGGCSLPLTWGMWWGMCSESRMGKRLETGEEEAAGCEKGLGDRGGELAQTGVVDRVVGGSRYVHGVGDGEWRE